MHHSLVGLPFKLLDRITEFLDLADVVALRQTCSSLLQLISDPSILRRLIACEQLMIVEDLSLSASRQDCWKNLARIGILWRQYTLGPMRRFQVQGLARHWKDVRAISHDGHRVVCLSSENRVYIWDTHSESQPFVELNDRRSLYPRVDCLAFSSSGRLVAVSTSDGLEVWDVHRHPPEVVKLVRKNTYMENISFSPDESMVAAPCYTDKVGIWRWQQDPTQFRVLSGHSKTVRSARFSPDSRYIASASNDSTIRIWDLSQDPAPYVILNQSSVCPDAEFSSDGRYVVMQEWDKRNKEAIIRRWDCSSKIPKAVMPSLRQYAVGNQVRDNRAVFATLRGLLQDKAFPYGSTVSPDGRFLATFTLDKISRMWDLSKNPPDHIVLQKHTSIHKHMAFSPNGAVLLIVEEWGNMYMYDFTPRMSVVSSSTRMWDVKVTAHEITRHDNISALCD